MTYDHAAIDAAPMAQHHAHQIKKRGRGTPQPRDTRPTRLPLILGAIILLGDGSACQIVALEPQPLCVPVPVPTE